MVAEAVCSRENAVTYTGLDRVKGMKPGEAESRVKGSNSLAEPDVRVFVLLVVRCLWVFCL